MTEQLAPPSTALTLTPPPAPDVVTLDKADPETSTLVPVPDADRQQAQAIAKAWVDNLTKLPARSPDFARAIAEIESVARDETKAISSQSSRLLDRPAQAFADSKGNGSGVTPQAKAAGNLAELRTQVERLTPNGAGLSKPRKLLGLIPLGDKAVSYFSKYQSAQSHLDAILKSLKESQKELGRDNAAIDVEKQNLWNLMGVLAKNSILVSAAAKELQARIDVTTDPEMKAALTSDALFVAQQRHQDMLTLLGVAAQGYMALNMVQANNRELIKGVDRAESTTMTALRIAVTVSEALTNQKLVLDQISGLNATTSNLIEANARMLQTQGVAIQQQAIDSTVDIAKLQAAFDSTFQAMDAVDQLRAGAAENFGKTIEVLEGQITRARPYLERAAAQDDARR